MTLIEKSKNNNILIVVLLCLVGWVRSFNDSVCNTFQLAGVYYTINMNYTNQNRYEGNTIFNYCQQVQYYCEKSHSILLGSLIYVDGQSGCYVFKQDSIQLLDQQNISKGVKVIYRPVNSSIILNGKSYIEKVYECQGEGSAGCPDVEQSTIFTFLKNRQLGFTITIQIIGIIFMVLGLYIYRASIVLLGACTMFFILLAIQVPIIFKPGVPHDIISNILILSGICSFFAGYVFGYFPKLGIFMLGCWIGLIISLTMNNIAFFYIPSNPANLTLWIVMPILCVLFGILSLFIRKTFIIFATSLIGAYMCLRALSWYLGAFPNQFLIARRYHLGLTGPVSWKFYLYVIALIILTASSSALQYWLFTKKSQITNKNQDIDEQFGNIEAQMKAKRQNLANLQQIQQFKKIFKGKSKNKAPKILKRKRQSQQDQQDENGQEEQQNQLQDEQQEPSQEKPAISRKQLNKRYIVK